MKAADANPNKEEANQAMGLAMMGLLQQLTFNSASIRFDDATITKRVLDYIGWQQGVSGDQLAQSLKGMVPMMMAQLNVPELQNQVSTAVNSYLDAPKSLTISAAAGQTCALPDDRRRGHGRSEHGSERAWRQGDGERLISGNRTIRSPGRSRTAGASFCFHSIPEPE